LIDLGQRDEPQPPHIERVTRFGALYLFTPEELVQFKSLHNLVKRYIVQIKPPRPLSFAVFGPPGSGKSFAVNQIFAEVGNELKSNLRYTKVNLTQVLDSRALGKVLASGEQTDNTVPVFFFDEFDAPRDGAPYGWLAWFLGPMQDGEFIHDGKVILVHRAIFIFAGGTASTMQEFSSFEGRRAFSLAKGPDFISRLRGFLNVSGPNAEPRMLRRAVILRAELESRAERNGTGAFRPDPDLLKSLLQVGRYRHGARSIAAVVELSDINENKRQFGWEELPEDHLLGQHIDRGPLDRKSIGGAIALSGYGESSSEQTAEISAVNGATLPDDEIALCWRGVARSLWRQGATLSYAGRWAAGERGLLMKQLAQELQSRPPEPSAKQYRREQPDPWLENFVDDTPDGRERTMANNSVPHDTRKRYGLHVTISPHLTQEERGRDPWLGQVLERFRRRLAVSEVSVARFVIAGATTRHYGRFPGIAEEVMLTLAQGKPVYIAGAFGGAASDVGSLLGLSHPRKGLVPASLQAHPKENEQLVLEISDELQPGPWADLPVTAADLGPFFKAHALSGPKWPENGLTFAENRELFASRDLNTVVALVTKGLLQRFGSLAGHQ
jgi:hypothetical protein